MILQVIFGSFKLIEFSGYFYNHATQDRHTQQWGAHTQYIQKPDPQETLQTAEHVSGMPIFLPKKEFLLIQKM